MISNLIGPDCASILELRIPRPTSAKYCAKRVGKSVTRSRERSRENERGRAVFIRCHLSLDVLRRDDQAADMAAFRLAGGQYWSLVLCWRLHMIKRFVVFIITYRLQNSVSITRREESPTFPAWGICVLLGVMWSAGYRLFLGWHPKRFLRSNAFVSRSCAQCVSCTLGATDGGSSILSPDGRAYRRYTARRGLAD